MLLKIQSRNGKPLLKEDVTLSDGATLEDLQNAFYKAKPKFYPDRKRFTLLPAEGQKRGEVLQPNRKLAEYGLKDGTVVVFKDLGPQVAWRTVFFWEYFGPILVYSAFYFFPHFFYRGANIPPKKPVQQLALAYFTFHYTKRILETFLVHRFSHGTMPLFNLFKNCTYYWGFSAWVSYFVNHPLYTAPPPLQSYVALGLAMLCQLANFKCHLVLAHLRPAGCHEYRIPYGFLFNYITCANYTTEIYGWVCFTVATQTLTAGLFTLAGAVQMAEWALAKHRRLRKLFDGKDGRPKYPRRWVMLPPFF